MTVLVVGATGFVGGEIAHRLRQHQISTRGLVRGGNTHPKAKQLQDAGIQIAVGDLTVAETLAAACTGIDTVVTTATSMPSGANDGLRRVDLDGSLALIDAAERAGVKKFVYTSYSGNIRYDSPLETAKRASEVRLLQGPMQAVILRPSYFMEMWLSSALGFDPANGSVRIYGSGEGKGNYISAFDVAEFAVAAILRPYGEKNTILEMGGPDELSQLDAVHIFEQALGRKIELSFVPEEALRRQHGSNDPLQKTFAALMLGYAQGDVITGARALAEQYGVALRSVKEYAAHLRAQEQVQSVA
ncbi:MAG TPA: SDR family oxidoreductase [Candidatus Acidoferrum sp.]|nr:SDR family oxidoreductase [Candidatus Acidoferrum sp.]